MNHLTRRELIQSAGFLLAGSQLHAAGVRSATYDWAPACRIAIAEAYNPPFYPAFDYNADKAVRIAKELNADSLRYPAASYFAYFPTKTKYPIHPELGGKDPMRRTVELCRDAGLKVVAYVPLNHPFMQVKDNNPQYQDWTKRFADGKPMVTEHYGYETYYEGCLNSPVRAQITELVREVLVNYPVDIMYFDGPYMGMKNAKNFCHCKYCQAAYQKARGKPIPRQDDSMSLDEEVEYTEWMGRDIVIAYLQDIREMIRKTRDVPTLYNDTSLLSKREWRSKAFPVVDGFMFEAAETPEEKLFNLQLGQSTGKIIWTYVGTHTQYNREHLKNERVRGWFSYPVESQELLLDGATALAAGAGMVYWGISRFHMMPKDALSYESGRYVKEVFDLAEKEKDLYTGAQPSPQAGILVGSQTIDWYRAKSFMSAAYANSYHGAYQLLKDNSFESEPFLDYMLTPDSLRKYTLLYIPNAPCLSDKQCTAITDYVANGGTLLATHLTSIADEYGRMRKNFVLAELFGATLESPDPVEIPDLYVKFPDGDMMPQDPQIVRFKANPGATVLAETWDVGHRKNHGPAIVTRQHGKGRVIYIGSSLEAVYEETRMKPLREYFGKLLDPVLGPSRRYQIDWTPGVTPHFRASQRSLYLHLLADTGNKWKKLRVREEYVPVSDIRARIRVPQGRKVETVSLVRAGSSARHEVRGDSVHVTVPRVFIHEAIRVDLA